MWIMIVSSLSSQTLQFLSYFDLTSRPRPLLVPRPHPLAAPPLADVLGAGDLAGGGPVILPRPLEPDAILLHGQHNALIQFFDLIYCIVLLFSP